MKESYILAIDYGTQSVRASIFNKNGECLAMEKEIYSPAYFSDKPGHAEQDPNLYFDCLTKCSKRLSSKHKDLMESVVGICQTCFRDSAVLLDKDYKVIRPMVLWLDQRFAECKKPMPLKNRFLFSLVGMLQVMQHNRRRTISNWIIENEPENWAKTYKYAQVSAYFIYLLTGRLADASSSFTGHYPINFKKKQWYKNPLKHPQGYIFSLRKDQLPEIVAEGEVIGQITKEASEKTGIPEGLPVYACGSDKSCETLGDGVIDSDYAAISLGTACSIETTTVKYYKHDKFYPAAPSCVPGFYNIDYQVYRGFWMLKWFEKEFCSRDGDFSSTDYSTTLELNKKLKDVPAGSDGLILQPYWGSLLERPFVKGSIVGFTDGTTKMHLYRAIIEGIFYSLRDEGESFQKIIKNEFKEYRVSGGGAESDEICQICADIFGKPVRRAQTVETSSLGAAIAGFLAAGVYKTPKEATEAMVKYTSVFNPNMENHKIYNKFFNVYKKQYSSLKKSYQTLWDLTKR